jgi:hypothetical protein
VRCPNSCAPAVTSSCCTAPTRRDERAEAGAGFMLGSVRRVVLSVVAVAALAVLAGCGSSAKGPPHKGPPPVARLIGCGTTALHRGSVPGWTSSAWSSSSGAPGQMPWALSTRGSAAAFLFSYPLHVGTTLARSNKILWIVRLPRDSSTLRVRAKPLGHTSPVIRRSWPPDSGPGQIYPSSFSVPRPGCWRVTIQWAGHSDSLDLKVGA